MKDTLKPPYGPQQSCLVLYISRIVIVIASPLWFDHRSCLVRVWEERFRVAKITKRWSYKIFLCIFDIYLWTSPIYESSKFDVCPCISKDINREKSFFFFWGGGLPTPEYISQYKESISSKTPMFLTLNCYRLFICLPTLPNSTFL